MTAARRLGLAGFRVLLVEQHSRLGGLVAWFRRRNHLFDVALHGFPFSTRKSFRKYWGPAFADRIVQLRGIRFDNPQFQLDTTFETSHFSHLLSEYFKIEQPAVERFFHWVRTIDARSPGTETIREVFERFFPARPDVWRFLLEPITYANGTTLDDPAVAYAVVFGNFMSRGVFTFQGGSDLLEKMMEQALSEAGVQIETDCLAERIVLKNGRVEAVILNGRLVRARAVISNGNLVRTVLDLVGCDQAPPDLLEQIQRVRVSNSSCQVYIGIRPDARLPDVGDVIFSSTWPEFDADAICSKNVSSRSFSVYYPWMRPEAPQYAVVASMNARYEDWAGLNPAAYDAAKEKLIQDTLDCFEKYVPDIRRMTDWTEAATPRTFERYTLHLKGASFGTKYEGVDASTVLPRRIPGLFHTGSTGIVMSGWLGAMNYGIITADRVERFLGSHGAG